MAGWDIEWESVECPACGNIQFQLKSGSSIWHTEISARNFKVPISTLQYIINGQWQALSRRFYNFFVLEQAISLPIRVKMTSVFGDSVETTISDYGILEPGLIDSGVQFSGLGNFAPRISAVTDISDANISTPDEFAFLDSFPLWGIGVLGIVAVLLISILISTVGICTSRARNARRMERVP